MKFLVLLGLFFIASQICNGQPPKTNHAPEQSLSFDLEKVVTDPFYLLILEDDQKVELEKSDLNKMDQKWVSKIEVWTDPEKMKEYGYEGKGGIVLITLKKKREATYLELIGKDKL